MITWLSVTLLEATSNPSYRNRLHEESSATVSTDDIPDNAKIEAAYLYWAGWIDWAEYAETDSGPEQGTVAWSNDCSTFNDWDAGSDWSVSGGEFRRHHSGSETNRYLTMDVNLDLSAYSGEEVTISWNQDYGGGLENSDRLYYEFSGNGGGSWGGNEEAFRCYPPGSYTGTIPDQYLTADFRVRFYLYGFSSGGEYCYVDNIQIVAAEPAIFSDNCSNFDNWDDGDDWSVSGGEFRRHHSGSESDRYLTMNNKPGHECLFKRRSIC